MAQISNLPDEKFSKCICRLVDQIVHLQSQINYAQMVYQAEFNHRMLLGLTGDEAIKHYNDWMKKNCLTPFCVL